jgi:hypothetical protein
MTLKRIFRFRPGNTFNQGNPPEQATATVL